MPLVKTTLFPSVRSLMEDFWNPGSVFENNFFNDQVPAVNIKEKKKHFQIELAVPGYQKDDFKISIDDRILTISAETEKNSEQEEENYTRMEFSQSSFSRSFRLPENVSEDAVDAKYQDGLLKVTLAKNGEKDTPKKQINIT